MKTQNLFRLAFVAALSLFAFTAQAAGVDLSTVLSPEVGLALAVGMGNLEVIMKSVDGIEAKLKALSEKADGQMATLGKVDADTKGALENLGNQQRELAERLLAMEQKGVTPPAAESKDDTWGSQVIKSASYTDFIGGRQGKMRIEVKNTLTGSDTNVAPDRRPGIVPGASQMLTIEALLNGVPTTSNAIEFTKENVFTNAAAETAEGAAKPESSLTWTLVNMPISTVAHWIKISRQLAMDNTLLAAYVNNRMRYGVNRKVETALCVGDGVVPNISGIFDTGNFTAHGYAAAALGATLPKFVLIRKMIADLWNAGYMADAILLNPADFATMEIELLTATSNAVRVGTDAAGRQTLWGVPVVQSVGVTADTVAVGNFAQSSTVYNREGVVVEMSESDSDNFTKNLITLRAERRLALATEVPAAVRAGDLTPA